MAEGVGFEPTTSVVQTDVLPEIPLKGPRRSGSYAEDCLLDFPPILVETIGIEPTTS